MTQEFFQAVFAQNLLPLFVKGAVLIILFLYIIFAGVLIRQVTIMNKVLTIANFSPILTLISLIHLIASIGLFLLALVIL